MIAIVVSRADSASEHIGEQLLDCADWTVHFDDTRPDADGGGRFYRTDGFELREFEELHLQLTDAADAFSDPDLLVFASRHAGDTDALLTAHFTGNFGPAAYGGLANELADACPNALSRLVSAFDRRAPAGYDVGIECTHHGPSSVGVPSLFAELGSGPEQWADPDAALAVAQAILDLHGTAPHADRQLVGFGGGHYAPRFERIVRETPWCVGHVAADWSLEAMGDPAESRDLVRQAFERSEAELALVDGEWPALVAVIEELGFRVVSETWLRETASVSPSLVAAVESSLGSVEAGVRFGDRTDASPADMRTVELPRSLLDEVTGIDPDRTRALVSRSTVAFETTENGTRIGGRASVVDDADRERLVEELVELLRVKYDAVERVGDDIVARVAAFDPERARELGVPEGPAFGRLASGHPVEVDGEWIEPERVTTERRRRFPLESC